ncbi:putative Polycomb group protein ASXL3 [Oryzias melastigma]|uniref:Putative Polycomb group protein ASXL3 n=1 Tax=Oryzias melastigma TaxID=30732 RepID=A0A834L3E1_ORYME|nr:putative Polycomb group protein ASXL3 [Oryzias melastigma]
MSAESPQAPSPQQDGTVRPLKVEEVEETSAAPPCRFTDRPKDLSPDPNVTSKSSASQSVKTNHLPESARVSEMAGKGCVKTILTQTSIPDSIPRFGTQGVDILQTISTSSQNKEQDRQKKDGPCVNVQYSSHHEEEQEVPSRPLVKQPELSPPQCDVSLGISRKKEDDVNTHSDSTETASDCENEGQQDPDQDWRYPLSTPTQQLILQPNMLGHPGQTVIQPCFSNGLPELQHNLPDSQDHHSVITAPMSLREKNSVVKLKLKEDRKASRASSVESPVIHLNAAPKRPAGPSRSVSSVEANNPLVTQLLQGSLPLEKVLPSHSANNRLEISRLPGTQSRTLNLKNPGARGKTEAPSPEDPAAPQVLNLSSGEQPGSGQAPDYHTPSAVPVITSAPPSFSSPGLSSKAKPDVTAAEPPVNKSHGSYLPQEGAANQCQDTHRSTLPSPPHVDPCPLEGGGNHQGQPAASAPSAGISRFPSQTRSRRPAVLPGLGQGYVRFNPRRPQKGTREFHRRVPVWRRHGGTSEHGADPGEDSQERARKSLVLLQLPLSPVLVPLAVVLRLLPALPVVRKASQTERLCGSRQLHGQPVNDGQQRLHPGRD